MATISSPHASSESPGGARDVESAPGWHPATRVAFRFCFLYFGLYVVTTQMLQAFLDIPGLELPDLGILPPARPLFLWIGRHILGLAPPSRIVTGTGDTVYGWIQSFSLLLIAIIGTVIWSVVARRRTAQATLYGWFRLFLRIALGVTFVFYGSIKVIPTQMPALDLPRLVEPFGNFSPMGVLWSSTGASPAYEIATGGVELLGGLLLFFPVTTIVGALVCLLSATMVFLANMTYDVNLKLFSFHLIAMSLFLLAPNARPLFDLFIRHRPGSLRPEPAVDGSPSAWRKIVIAQAVFCVYTLAIIGYGSITIWKTSWLSGGPRLAIFGIWDVDSMAVGGAAKPPLLSDSTRWRRVIFQGPMATFQRMDDTFRQYAVTVDSTARSLTLSPVDTTPSDIRLTADTTKPKSLLTYRRVDREHLIIDGKMDQQDVHLALTFRDPDSFLQRSRGFHWISEVPFNR
ncbi:MAG TPA: hypothetical protein VGJ18_16460 [Gemmatimonadaceae bacterium]|jgi:hypothetical protein